MNIGQVISAAGHATLIGWMVFGGIFRTEQLPIEATEVSVISGEAFAALMAAQDSPTSQSEITQPAQPVVDNTHRAWFQGHGHAAVGKPPASESASRFS